MSLPHALLGLLHYRPATGYELKTAFNDSIHFFWDATLPQIYRTLNQMEENGWLIAKVEHQKKKPTKKIYRVTAAGIGELRRWLAEPVASAEPRLPTLIKVFFGSQMTRERLVDHLRQWRDQHAAMLEKFDKEVEPVIAQYGKLIGSPEEARNWGLTLDFGRRYARMVVDWCDAALASRKKGVPAPGKRRKS